MAKQQRDVCSDILSDDMLPNATMIGKDCRVVVYDTLSSNEIDYLMDLGSDSVVDPCIFYVERVRDGIIYKRYYVCHWFLSREDFNSNKLTQMHEDDELFYILDVGKVNVKDITSSH